MAKTITPPTAEQITARLAELKLPLNPAISYELANLFPKIDGWFINNTIKTKAKLVRLVEPKLLEMLRPGEKVLYVSKGVQQSVMETLVMGALWAALLNQTVFVLTNVRVLVFRSNSSGKPLHQFWQIYYSEIDKMKGGWMGTISLKFEDRKGVDFGGLQKVDRETMIRVFEESLDEYERRGFAPEVSQSMEPLCCECHKPVDKGEYECEECGAIYWKPSQLALSSLLIPSWGDFLMGHYGLAIMELIGYLIGLGFCLSPIFIEQQPDLLAVGIVLVIFFMFAHVVDAGLTYVVGQKGLYLRKAGEGE